MLLHLPIVIMATLSPIAASDTVPQFDIVRECRFEAGSTIEFDRCSDDEKTALRDLQQAWVRFAGADRRNCALEARTGGFASYVELLTCLEMKRDLGSADENPRGPQTTAAMRVRVTGATVGGGHDSIAPGQVQGAGSR